MPDTLFSSGKLTRREAIVGWVYVPIHMFLLPLLLNLFAYFSPTPVDTVTLNIVYYAAGALFVLLALRRLLRQDFDVLLDSLGTCLLTIIAAYFIDSVLSAGVLLFLDSLLETAANPNNNAVMEMAETSGGAAFGLAVFIGPLVEETLFRGVVFGSIRKKHRVLAYVVSILIFSLYHVWQYALAYMSPAMLLYAIQYIPISFALAWSYDRTGSIWTPIFFHMALNALAMFVTSSL